VSLDKMTVPGKIKVGFHKRPDCYSGLLGYVIYQDAKGVWRKEKSWEGWRKKELDPKFFDNVPTDGFVLNRKVGGAKESWGWNVRLEKVRVWDPRDFEFEISVPNLLFILRETDCSRGKGLEGKFVYAWSGTELVLCPVNSQEYKDSVGFTALQTKTIKAKELVPGVTYLTKKQVKLVYLGRFDVYTHRNDEFEYRAKKKTFPAKEYVFWNGKEFEFMDTPKTLAAVVTDVIDSNLAEYLEAFGKSNYGSKIKELFIKEGRKAGKNSWHDFFAIEDKGHPGSFIMIDGHGDYYRDKQVTYSHRVSLQDGRMQWTPIGQTAYKSPNTAYWNRSQSADHPYIDPTNIRLFARMETGSVYRVGYGDLVEVNQVEEPAEQEEVEIDA
jgi:hypothetical protein